MKKLILTIISLQLSSLTAMPLTSLFIISKTAQNIKQIKSVYISSKIDILDGKDLELSLTEKLYYNRNTGTIDIIINNLTNHKMNKITRRQTTCSSIVKYRKLNLDCKTMNNNVFYRTLFISGLNSFLHNTLLIDYDNSQITFKQDVNKNYIAPNDVKFSLVNKKPSYEIGRSYNKIYINPSTFDIIKLIANNTEINYDNYKEYQNKTIRFPSFITLKINSKEAVYNVSNVQINLPKPAIFNKVFSTNSLDSDISDYIIKFR